MKEDVASLSSKYASSLKHPDAPHPVAKGRPGMLYSVVQPFIMPMPSKVPTKAPTHTIVTMADAGEQEPPSMPTYYQTSPLRGTKFSQRKRVSEPTRQ